MEKYINEHGKECYKNVSIDSPFNKDLFHLTDYQFEDDKCWAFHTNLGSLTVLDRMTGFGHRDVESGFRDKEDNFWLASGYVDVRWSGAKTVGEAIEFVKKNANTCAPIEKEVKDIKP